MDLEGKVALVTGASRGIGESICLKLLEKGAKVYGTSRKESSLHPFEMIKLDVADESACKNAVDKVIGREGRIDIFVSNAGMGIAGAVEDTDIEEAKMQLDINFFGSLRMLANILPIMREQKSGRIILMSSVAGFLSLPYQGMYSAAKYATEAIGMCLRNELRGYGVEVMLINPGDTKTGFTENRIYSGTSNESSDYYKRFIRAIKKVEKAEMNGMDPSTVAKGIIRKLEKRRLGVRYVPGYYKWIFRLTRLLPEKLVLLLLKIIYT